APQQADNSGPADSATALRRKVVNNAVGTIRSLAERRGRNADWAETAVRTGATLTAQAALEKNVIDLIAADPATLVRSLDGRQVTTAAGTVTLKTGAVVLNARNPDWRNRLLAAITHPGIAYLLMMVGIFGLLIEAFNPGVILPGVVGAICLLVALFAFQILPVNYTGLALLLLGVALMVAEAFAPSFGALGLGGIAAFVIGSILFMDTDVPGYRLPIAIIAAVATACGLLLFLMLWLFARARRKPVATGREGLVGARAEALEAFAAQGFVRVHGERWHAVSHTPVASGDSLRVVGIEGLTVTVEPLQE
ncbi:MAG: nodulation protein NfeD, partial [Salinisphaera sp.]|nr:nodulation protein NfeD [Salinisphaera sp.]